MLFFFSAYSCSIIHKYILFIIIFLIDGFISLSKINETNSEICIICLNKIKDPVKPDTCKHIFCERCFEVYIQSFDKCPTCKIKFNQILKLYDPNLVKKGKIGLFGGNLEDKLYRFSSNFNSEDHCIICKKNDNPDFLLVCDRCLINQAHYYCDPSLGIAFGIYICKICRNRFYKNLKKNK